jgi:hypothetical protein
MQIFIIFDFIEILLGKKIIIVSNLVFFGSQEAVLKIWAKNWIFHAPEVVD